MIVNRDLTILSARPVGQKGWYVIETFDSEFSAQKVWTQDENCLKLKGGTRVSALLEVPQDAFVKVVELEECDV